MKQNDVEMNRAPLNRYKRTFRAQGGELDKGTPEGLSAWGFRHIAEGKPGPVADEEFAKLQDWEWDTTMRIREVEALEQIAEVAEACRLNHVESLTCGELMEGVTFSSEAFHEHDGTGETLHSYVRLALDDMGLGFDVRSINDEPAECYGDATAEWHFQSPDELHALAAAFRTKYAYMLDMVATTWAQRIADGTIPAVEA